MCNTSHLLFSSAEMFKKPLWQTAIGAVCSGSTLFASILNPSVMVGNYLQQTTSADNISRCGFFLGALRVKIQILPVLLSNVMPISIILA